MVYGSLKWTPKSAAGRAARKLPMLEKQREPHTAYPRIYLRCVDPGTDCECWVVCAKDDRGAIAFLREDGI